MPQIITTIQAHREQSSEQITNSKSENEMEIETKRNNEWNSATKQNEKKIITIELPLNKDEEK